MISITGHSFAVAHRQITMQLMISLSLSIMKLWNDNIFVQLFAFSTVSVTEWIYIYIFIHAGFRWSHTVWQEMTDGRLAAYSSAVNEVFIYDAYNVVS